MERKSFCMTSISMIGRSSESLLLVGFFLIATRRRLFHDVATVLDCQRAVMQEKTYWSMGSGVLWRMLAVRPEGPGAVWDFALARNVLNSRNVKSKLRAVWSWSSTAWETDGFF
jgi:hypothetical protein